MGDEYVVDHTKGCRKREGATETRRIAVHRGVRNVFVIWCLSLVLGIPVGAAFGQRFAIQDSEGNTYGPFLFKQGARIRAGRMEFTISNVGTADVSVLGKLNSIRLPAIDFEDASIDEIVKSLQRLSVEADPEKKGVNLVLNLADTETDKAIRAIPKVTFSARDITLLDAMKLVALPDGTRYVVESNAVVICPSYPANWPIVVTNYDVLSSFHDVVANVGWDESGKPGAHVDEFDPRLKRLFAARGVTWPDGSYIRYLPIIGRLTVANTETNLALFWNALIGFFVVPFEIQIEVDFVAFEKTDLAKLGAGGICQEALMDLWTNGQAELIAAPRVLTKPGQEASIKGVTECIYPSEYVMELTKTTNMNPVTSGGVVRPASFQTREIGTTMRVMAEVSESGRMILVTATPEYTQEPTWQKYSSTWMTEDGKNAAFETEQPFFHAHAVTTSVALYPGTTLLAGGGVPSNDGQKLIFMFLSAWLVDWRGNALQGR